MTTPISSPTFSGTGTAAQTKSGDQMGSPDMFMKLLVAQMQYQDPMAPSDTGQQMSQMAMFTQVEKLTQLLTSQQASQTTQERLAAESLIGKKVSGLAADQTTHTGTVSKVDLSGTTPELTLADGSTVAVGDVTSVEQS